MKRLFRPCATLRLFIPDLIVGVDKLVYVDTDVIFLNRPQELMNIDLGGKGGGGEKLAALAPCLFHYGSTANQVPYYGSSGLNAGTLSIGFEIGIFRL